MRHHCCSLLLFLLQTLGGCGSSSSVLPIISITTVATVSSFQPLLLLPAAAAVVVRTTRAPPPPTTTSNTATSRQLLNHHSNTPCDDHQHHHEDNVVVIPPEEELLQSNNDDNDDDDDDDEVKRWQRDYCSVARLRAVHGRNRRGDDVGDWNYVITRTFYKFKLNRALKRLQELDNLPQEEELGALAFQARRAIKTYARERSKLLWRFHAEFADGIRQWIQTGRFDSQGKSLQQLQHEKRIQIITNKTSQENTAIIIDNDDDDVLDKMVSLEILKSAGRTNEFLDYLLSFRDIGGLDVKACYSKYGLIIALLLGPMKDMTQFLQVVTNYVMFSLQDETFLYYEDVVAALLLDSSSSSSDGGGDHESVASRDLKKFLRGVFPYCVRKLIVSQRRRRRRCLCHDDGGAPGAAEGW